MLLIGEVAHKSGVAASTIRYYEELGLAQPLRRESGRRLFGDEAVNRLRAIAAAQEAGFTLDEIRQLLDSQAQGTDQWRTLVEDKISSVEALVDRLLAIAQILRDSLGCGCRAWDACSIVISQSPVDCPVKDPTRNVAYGL